MPSPRAPVARSRPVNVDDISHDDQLDLISGLWQEVPFVRLPSDAPTELRQLVTDIENPRRVYAIHRASRRHDFQSMVEKFIFQLREGCGSPSCTTSSCFTCRKRLAGKTPIRRYNTSSARTLAVYLASRDNPERGLCPTLRLPKDGPNAMLNNLIFETTAKYNVRSTSSQRSNPDGSPPSPKIKVCPGPKPTQAPSPRSRELSTRNDRAHTEEFATNDSAKDDTAADLEASTPEYAYRIRERPGNKDHRSFAANVFGTVAFRMLEWLTPRGMAAIHNKLSFDDSVQQPSEVTSLETSDSCSTSPKMDPPGDIDLSAKPSTTLNGEPPEKLAPVGSPLSSSKDPTKPRRSSEATFRTSQPSNSKRKMSIEPPTPAAVLEEPKSPTMSPRVNGIHPEKITRSLKPAAVPRGVIEIPPKSTFFESAPITIPPTTKSSVNVSSTKQEHTESPSMQNLNDWSVSAPADSSERASYSQPNATLPDLECPPPQALRSFNVDVVNFICNTFEEDQTGERYVDPIFRPGESYPQPQKGLNQLRRLRFTHKRIPRHQWKAFNEQTLFNVLSDPNALIASFTRGGELFDSHTLWYLMLRLTRAAPSLVFHSLWIASDNLFSPPKEFKQLKSSRYKNYRMARTSLSHTDAGHLMSICMHALVASVPICPDSFSLRELSRIRAKGLTLSTVGDTLPQPAWLREDFDDAFSDELAVRLMRRLCCAITTRRRFKSILDSNGVMEDTSEYRDVLQPLLDQVDVMGTDSTPVLEFSKAERLLHEGRVESLMLAWARIVLFHDWDGNPEFSVRGPFAGAMSLIESIHDRKEFLVVTEREFRMDYFSDRLDSMDIPISWLTFLSTNEKRHLLDFPYLFSPDALVSFFRSINFLRMSRTYEESSSLKARMKAILDPGSLITIPHHKMVLQDLLKTASSSYLILEVSRKNVIRDAFDQLWRREERELLRPLKVHLGEDGGEEGFDSGGVQQEFLRLAIAECLDPDNGAFTVDERTRMAWFSPSSVVETWKYELVGILMSLAVFNGLTLPVTFPKALYCKLLGWPVTDLEHIEDGWPDLASGLTTLQEWDENNGLVEDIFARTYEFSVFTYGSHVTRDMTKNQPWPQTTLTSVPSDGNSEDAPLVTGKNRDDYVNDYINYLTNVSIQPQYSAFEKGFRACLDPKSLTLLNPQTLQSLVEGVQEIDVSELRRYTRYVGWDASHRTVKDFWSIVKRYDDRMKRKLLEFVTASDRVPVGGMRNLQFVVQKNGEEEGDGGHLPTAYTCYGTLLLPEYKDKEVLRQRMGMALENAQGFGFA